MKVTLEQIDELRNRVNVSYEEAKSTLEKNDGDLIKSIIELEKRRGRKAETKGSFTNFANRLLSLKLSVRNKDGETLINIPLVLVLLTFIMAFWVVIFGLVLAILTSCKIKIYKDKNSMNVSSLKKNMKDTVDKIKVKSEEIIVEAEKDEPAEDSGDNEIIIE
ncbi:MAG: DUF4342 domain-containing protein [Sedimentibacter sp.]|uniref:DUF4342 domain-containing protein n=1 Tax=Sedimentibacter sp. TaxID=1960295 RepID=UPI0031593298